MRLRNQLKMYSWVTMIFCLLSGSVHAQNALNLNGSNDRITVPDQTDLRLNRANFSVSIRVKPEAIQNRADLILHGQNNVVWDNWALVIINGSAQFQFGTGSAAPTETVTQTGTLPLNTWTTITATFDGNATSNQLKLYIDGTLNSSATVTGQPGNSGSILQIGGDDGRNYFDGTMDDLAIWNVTLSSSQVGHLAAESVANIGGAVQGTVSNTNVTGLNWANLLAYYPMNTGSGTTLIDASNSGFNGTFVNSPAWLASTNLWLKTNIVQFEIKDTFDELRTTWLAPTYSPLTVESYQLQHDIQADFASAFSQTITDINTTSYLLTANFTMEPRFVRVRPVVNGTPGNWSNQSGVAESVTPGQALQLDGTSGSYVDLGNSLNSFNQTKPFTVEFWVKPDAANASGPLLTKYNSGNWGQFKIFMENGLVKVDRNVSPWNLAESTTNLQADTWYHVAAVYDGANIHLFINGVSESSVASGSVSTDSNSTNTTVYIGRETNTGQGYFAGQFDEVRIWGVARTSTELNNNKGKRILSDGNLLLYYGFDQSSASDLSPSMLTATENGVTYPVSTAPVITDVYTPVMGFTSFQQDGLLSWEVTEESGVNRYEVVQLVDGQWVTVATIPADGSKYYEVSVGEGTYRILVIDRSGFVQSFAVNSPETLISLNLQIGWNMISLPFTANLSDRELWIWNSEGQQYQLTDQLEPLQGAWIWSETAETVDYFGQPEANRLNLHENWNLVGVAENCQIEADGLTIYSWDKTYQGTSVLATGQAYWIHAEEAQALNLD